MSALLQQSSLRRQLLATRTMTLCVRQKTPRICTCTATVVRAPSLSPCHLLLSSQNIMLTRQFSDHLVGYSEFGGGRKRYVELEPKIALEEFRKVQREHFPHLDRAGQEIILQSFREDLLVEQRKGRQNRELRRDCLLFLTVVSVIDFIIVSM